MARSSVPREYAEAIRKYAPQVDGLARKRYGISGAALLAKLLKGESGFRMNAVSPAGARGAAQFMPGSRRVAIQKFGVDPWRSPEEAVKGAVLHLLGKINGKKGLEGYNPGGGQQYVRYILKQPVGDVAGDVGVARGGSARTVDGGGERVDTPIDRGGAERALALLDLLQSRRQPRGVTATMPLPQPVASGRAHLRMPAGRRPLPVSGGVPQPQDLAGEAIRAAFEARGSAPEPVAFPDGEVGARGGGAGGRRGKVVVAKGANRPGAGLTKGLMGFLANVAGIYGRTITVGTGTDHSRLTVDGKVSDHWDGNGADIPVPRGSKRGDRIAAAALIAAGVPAKEARQMARKGGMWNLVDDEGTRWQIIWKTSEGGDHYGHVHIGRRPGRGR